MSRSSIWRILLAATGISFAPPVASLHAQADTSRARPAATTTDSGPPIHIRILGVFDEESGKPVPDVDVADLNTGIVSRTTSTGTVGLIFRDTSGTLVRIRKVGYQAQTMIVGSALNDTTPVTAILTRAGRTLAPVITVGNRTVKLGPTDTNSVLLRNGFYERRLLSAAPASAFVTGDKLRGNTVVSNARYYGRAICESNVFIDGVPVKIARGRGRSMREGIDAMLDVTEIAGIETYRTGEMPVGVTHTTDGPLTTDVAANMAANAMNSAAGTLPGTGCVTMIWLNR